MENFDLYKKFFSAAINSGRELSTEELEIAQQIRSLQNSSAETSTCSAKSAPEVFAGIH